MFLTKIIIFAISIFLSILNLNFLPLSIFLIYKFRKERNVIFIGSFIALIFLLSLSRIKININKELRGNEFDGKIIEVDAEKYIIKHNEFKIMIYEENNYNVGDMLIVYGNVEKASNETYENQFNYKKYLEIKGIYNIIYNAKSEFKKNEFSIFRIRYDILKNIDENYSEKTSDYIKALIFGESKSLDIKDNLNEMGISHLFVISGLHIGLLVIVLSKVLNMFISKKNSEIIIIVILLFYAYLTNFGSSVIRATIMYVLVVINNRTNKKFTSLDIVSVTIFLMLLINPLNIYEIGFIYSFLMTFTLILIRELMVDKNIVYQAIIVSVIALVFTLPITIYSSYSINLFTIIFNLIYSFLIILIILPLTFAVLFFPILNGLTEIIYNDFEKIILLTNKLELRLNFPRLPIILYLLYYLTIIKLIIKLELKKNPLENILSFLIMLFIMNQYNTFDPTGEVTFLTSSYNSEFILIREPFNSCNIVIDVGENYKFNQVENKYLPFLKSKGINRLDYVFITHNHNDHIGGIKELNKNIKIDNLILSEFNEFNELPHIKISVNDNIKCGDLVIDVIGPLKKDENLNNNSLILHTKIGNKYFLFTGDAEIEQEIDILSNYKDIKIDILKVAHHGSNSSSNIDFLEHYKPGISIINVSLYNLFNHPDDEVIDRLLSINSTIYRTDIDNSIKYSYLFNKSGIFETF